AGAGAGRARGHRAALAAPTLVGAWRGVERGHPACPVADPRFHGTAGWRREPPRRRLAAAARPPATTPQPADGGVGGRHRGGRRAAPADWPARLGRPAADRRRWDRHGRRHTGAAPGPLRPGAWVAALRGRALDGAL